MFEEFESGIIEVPTETYEEEEEECLEYSSNPLYDNFMIEGKFKKNKFLGINLIKKLYINNEEIT